jgi:hypothetical protein
MNIIRIDNQLIHLEQVCCIMPRGDNECVIFYSGEAENYSTVERSFEFLCNALDQRGFTYYTIPVENRDA